MKSLPFLSHRLFVAAVGDENVLPAKRARKKTGASRVEAARVIPLEHTNCDLPLRTVAAQTLPASSGMMSS